MTRRPIWRRGVVAVPVAWVAAVCVTTTSEAAPPSAQRALLDRYCVTCHNQKLNTANLTLDTLDVDQVKASPEVWEKVARKVRMGAMPPAGMPRPDTATAHAFASSLTAALDAAAALRPDPGRRTIHRLNRAEYGNAVRDLLAIELDVRSLLPADDSGYGFDNIADVLSLSSGLLERYLSAAAKISRRAVGDATIRPGAETYKMSRFVRQDARMNDDLPFGSRGGIAVRHLFPVDGEYIAKIRLTRSFTDQIGGLAEPHELEIRLDRGQLRRFTIGGKCVGESAPRCTDADLEVRFHTQAGSRLIGVAFLDNPVLAEGPLQERPSVNSLEYSSVLPNPSIDALQIIGPSGGRAPDDTPSRRAIFSCHPARGDPEKACAERILARLARRAYRRPVTKADTALLLGLYEKGRSKGGFEAGIEWALERILVSPDFLFRMERDPLNVAAGSAYRLNDVELASRLSFFLWSSIPDEPLLALAERSKLREPGVLSEQVKRMLADPRSSTLVSNFAGQWLQLRNLGRVLPDSIEFPEFDGNLREAFQRETELFVESQLREDRSVIDLLRADYTFLNERLAQHYQVPDVYGSHFRRVRLADDRRLGLLGHGSILTVTSYPTRTSPVVRGKWLLENLLGAPPPPPPPNVPALEENDEQEQPSSVRERLERHRRNPACATCHAQMDPLGFALENFDGVGKWRNAENGKAIDASGALPDGTRFTGPSEFRNTLLMRSEDFARTVTEKLLTYALGRGLEYYDAPAVRAVMRAAASSEYRWSSLILGIVGSVPFQMQSAPGTGATRAE